MLKTFKIIPLIMLFVICLNCCADNADIDSASASSEAYNSYPLSTSYDVPESVADALKQSGDLILYTNDYELDDNETQFLRYYEKFYYGNVEYIYVGKKDYITKFISSYASNTVPDAVLLDSVTWPTVYIRDMIYSRNELEQAGILGLEHPVLEADYDICSSNFTVNDNCYAIAADTCNSMVIAVNVDLLSRFSVDSPVVLYNKGEWNFDTFYKCCSDITRQLPDSTQITGYYGSNPNSFFTANDCELVRWNDNGALRACLDDRNVVSTFNFVRNLYSQGLVAASSDDFKNGHCAMLAGYANEIAEYSRDWRFYWDIVAFPQGDNNMSGVLPAAIEGVAVVKNSLNPQGVINYYIAHRIFDEYYYGDRNYRYQDRTYREFDDEQMKLIINSDSRGYQSLYTGIGTLYGDQWLLWKDVKSDKIEIDDVIDMYSSNFSMQCNAEMSLHAK